MTVCWNGAPVVTTVPCASYSTMITSGSAVSWMTTSRCSSSRMAAAAAVRCRWISARPRSILAAARRMFADLGYDRTTIRAVAKAAGVDAGLVMHYFGSKDELFARAATLPGDELPGDTAEQLAEALLASLAGRLDGEPVGSLAVLRSMLTNAGAADRYRAAGEPQLSRISAAIPAADAELRAGLL